MWSRWKSVTGPEAPPERPHRPDPFASLRLPDFRWFVLGSLVSNIGNQMRTATVGWEVYQRTGEALSLGLIGLVLAAPVLLLAMPAGVAADRYSRKTILILAHVGLLVCGLGLAWNAAVHGPLAWTYVLLLFTGISRAIGWPAMSAILTQMVPARLFANAATWRSMAFQTAATLGPLLGGAVLALASPAAAYLVDAATSAVFLVCIGGIKLAPQKRIATGLASWQSVLDGVRFVRREPLILSTITLDMVAVMFGGATALIPMYAEDVLDVGATGYGWLRAMPAIGSIAMGLLLAWRISIRRAGPALIGAVFAFGVWTIVFGASRNYAVSLLALFMLGAVDNVSVVIRSTLLQLLTPDELRGRVAAVNAIFINTSNEIGEFESGIAAHLFGPVLAVCGGGVLTLVTVAAIARTWPSLWRLGPLEEIRPRDETPDPAVPVRLPSELAEALPDPVVQQA
ncbi:MAG: MFS transporter [Pirellulales bacterium]|nr:MFS transporter [Pirellulales bacterium]